MQWIARGSGNCNREGARGEDGPNQVYSGGDEFFRRGPVGIIDPLLSGAVDGPTGRGSEQFRVGAAFGWVRFEAVHQDDADLVDYRALDEGFELALFGGTGFLEFREIVANGEDDRVKGSGAGTVKTDFPAFEELKKADTNELFKKGELVRVVGIEGRAIQGGGFGDVLNGDLVELFLFQETLESVLQEPAGPADARVELFAVEVKHRVSYPR